jgi:hypothetical protein
MKVARNDWKLPRNRRIAIADRLADMATDAEPTPFAIEGPARHGIRSSLCLQGWPWQASDYEAMLLLIRAHQIVGAKRPTWEQGQPEYTQPGVLPIERTNCVRCGKPLPEGHIKFCSAVCFKAHRLIVAERLNRDEINAKQKASRIAWSQKQPPRECKECRRTFQPKSPTAKFCSRPCALTAARRNSGRAVRLVCDPV